ncbi:MAG: CcmD family protein [Solirubrobacteraceae bacterium]
MIALLASVPAIPLGTGGRYVAAAYIVVLVLILSYVAIMAVRAQHVERELDELRRDVEAALRDEPRPDQSDHKTEAVV